LNKKLYIPFEISEEKPMASPSNNIYFIDTIKATNKQEREFKILKKKLAIICKEN
jgi:hypothetical protein